MSRWDQMRTHLFLSLCLSKTIAAFDLCRVASVFPCNGIICRHGQNGMGNSKGNGIGNSMGNGMGNSMDNGMGSSMSRMAWAIVRATAWATAWTMAWAAA